MTATPGPRSLTGIAGSGVCELLCQLATPPVRPCRVAYKLAPIRFETSILA